MKNLWGNSVGYTERVKYLQAQVPSCSNVWPVFFLLLKTFSTRETQLFPPTTPTPFRFCSIPSVHVYCSLYLIFFLTFLWFEGLLDFGKEEEKNTVFFSSWECIKYVSGH
jgi:hypothetical protein